ncbi:MAG: zinc-binding dehydrogenase [Pseudomonadales bacterium]|jgi:L-iditol 2-dehydrogenase|nr:zinc-binding dehydrogenase [Pseudomonadales bacterium]|tara:strand:+ start:31584 stop:32558 length:975 start_codon:yes stop_codon:yes gene_type:complete
MKACVATGEKRTMEYREVPMPAVEPGSLLLKTRCALICGSDLEYLDALHGEIEPGLIRGHEFVADVVEVGEGVTGWAAGDRAVPISFTGNYGCWADYFVSPQRGVQKVPEHVSDEAAVFVEPMHTGVGAVEACHLKPGESVVIIGMGKIGLLALLAAKVAGAAPIVAIDVDSKRLDKALELGAHKVINSNDTDAIKEVKKIFTKEGEHPVFRGSDAIIVAVRQGAVFDQALQMARQGSHIILAGFVPVTRFDPAILLVKQLTVSGIMAGRHGQNRNNGRLSLHMLAYDQLDPTPLISDGMPFKDIQRAIDSTFSGENLAILLTP